MEARRVEIFMGSTSRDGSGALQFGCQQIATAPRAVALGTPERSGRGAFGLSRTRPPTSSRARVTEYCESKLGMVQANNGIFERFGVEADANNPSLPVEFTQEFPQTNDLYRFSLLREGGKSSR